MIYFLRVFLVGILCYHILVTLIGYGVGGGAHPEYPAFIRDAARIGAVLCIFARNIRLVSKIFYRYRKLLLVGLVLLAWSILRSLWMHKTGSEIMIGIKYDYRYMFILLGGLLLGSLRREKKPAASVLSLPALLDRCAKVLVLVMIVGFLRQGAKLIFPNLFFFLGYGPLNDFHFGTHPPLYYLTGFGGTLRRQGIFAGPNNYGYFLVAFLPLLLYRIQKIPYPKNVRKIIKKYFPLVIWLLAIVFTLSRSAYIGTVVVLIWRYRERIRKHRKRSIGICVFLFGILAYLTILKGASSLAHITAKLNGFLLALAHPLGLGLGTAGPAVHHSGTILPENYYIQIVLEAGFPALLLWGLMWWYVLRISKQSSQGNVFVIGWGALMVMGLFLHVFEDSMVNYSFFFLWGIVIGIGYGLGDRKR